MRAPSCLASGRRLVSSGDASKAPVQAIELCLAEKVAKGCLSLAENYPRHTRHRWRVMFEQRGILKRPGGAICPLKGCWLLFILILIRGRKGGENPVNIHIVSMPMKFE